LIDEIRGMRKDLTRKDRKMTTLIDAKLSLQEKEPESYTDQTFKSILLVLMLAFLFKCLNRIRSTGLMTNI